MTDKQITQTQDPDAMLGEQQPDMPKIAAAQDGLPSGPGTAPKTLDVADPHPSNEDHFDRQRHPGGDHAPHDDIGPNSYEHDGTAPPKPRNVEDEGSKP